MHLYTLSQFSSWLQVFKVTKLSIYLSMQSSSHAINETAILAQIINHWRFPASIKKLLLLLLLLLLLNELLICELPWCYRKLLNFPLFFWDTSIMPSLISIQRLVFINHSFIIHTVLSKPNVPGLQGTVQSFRL